MTENINIQLVTPLNILTSKDVSMAVLPGSEGDLGIMYRHTPMMTLLNRGFVKLFEGNQLVENINKKPIEKLGHVTSSYFSPNLNKSIALAVVKSGKKLKGKKLIVPMENKNINVTITDTVFYDKENKRLNA